MACERRGASRFAFLGPFRRRRPIVRCHCHQLGAAHPWKAIGIAKKFSKTPLRMVRKFAILQPSADGPGSRKERDDLVQETGWEDATEAETEEQQQKEK